MAATVEDRLTEWEVLDLTTGEVEDVRLNPTRDKPSGLAWHGCEPPRSVMDAHRIATIGTVMDRAGSRMRYGGASELMRRQLRRGGGEPLSAEDFPPQGWAADWWARVVDERVPLSGIEVGRQLARLARGDRHVTVPDRSLADAVGRVDRAGRLHAYTERGVEALCAYGFIEKIVTGQKRGARTTYHLRLP